MPYRDSRVSGTRPCSWKKLRDRDRRQLDAEHAMALRGEPRHVQRLAGQWHEHARTTRKCQRRPVLFQQRQDAVVVEADALFAPAVEPEFRFHRASSRKERG